MSEETKNTAEAVNPAEFLANFNWHKYEEGIEAVDETKLKEFETALEGTVGFVNERDVIEGLVVRITDRDAIIDINSKSEGVISLNEFRYNPSLAVGDKVLLPEYGGTAVKLGEDEMVLFREDDILGKFEN